MSSSISHFLHHLNSCTIKRLAFLLLLSGKHFGLSNSITCSLGDMYIKMSIFIYTCGIAAIIKIKCKVYKPSIWYYYYWLLWNTQLNDLVSNNCGVSKKNSNVTRSREMSRMSQILLLRFVFEILTNKEFKFLCFMVCFSALINLLMNSVTRYPILIGLPESLPQNWKCQTCDSFPLIMPPCRSNMDHFT